MKILSKFTWLPVIPLTQPTNKANTFAFFIAFMSIVLWFCYLFSPHYLANYSYLIFWIIYFFNIHIRNYLNHKKSIIQDIYLRRFIGFNATLQEVIAILNPTTDYHYQIKIHTSDPIFQDQQQEWLITPNLYPIHLRALVSHGIYIESLANSHLIFNLKPYLLNQNQQEIFFTQYYLEYPKANGQYKKCRYNSIQKVELDTSQIEIRLFIWIKQQNIQIKLDETQLKLMETIFFPKLLMFSQRQYLAIKNQQAQGIIWQS